MPLEGEYEPSPWDWVRDQVATYERTGGREANTLLDTGLPIVVVTTRGNKSGKIRKTALMRVEHDGEYAIVASMGGAPKHPAWYFNLRANPHVTVEQGTEKYEADARILEGKERDDAYALQAGRLPAFGEYQQKTTRRIPVIELVRR